MNESIVDLIRLGEFHPHINESSHAQTKKLQN